MRKTLFCFGSLCLAACVSLSAETKANIAFEKLRALNGDWQGSVAWTGQKPSEVNAHYYITGNGSAVVEDLSNGFAR